MNSLSYALLSLYAQAGSPQTTPPGATPPTDAPPPPTAADQAAIEAAKAAAEAKAAEAAGQGGEGLNLLTLFNKLEMVEKVVMVILAVCAIYSIALLIEKVWVMRANNSKIKEFLGAFRKANSVEEAEAIVRKLPSSGIKTMFDAGMGEVRKTQDLGLYTMRDARDHTMQRVASAMQIKQNDHLEELGSSMTFLASIGSNAPFIGLFGTVWGIMNAFVGIVQTQSTSLVAVAPGIAGALLATAAGLLAAIPAVLIYNFSAKQISKTGGKYEDFASEFIALVSRDMDRRGA